MNNVTFMLVILGIGILIAINLVLIMTAWSKLSNQLGPGSTSMILVYTASIISYVILSTIFILLLIGFILFLVGYGKASESVTDYLMKLGYDQVEAIKLAEDLGPEGMLFYNETMSKDINNANSLRFQFNSAGEAFKSAMIMIYTFGLAIIFIMGLVALIVVDPKLIPNNSGYGLLLSSVVVSGLSLLVLAIVFFAMFRTSSKRLSRVSDDNARLSSLINKKQPEIDVSKLDSGFSGVI